LNTATGSFVLGRQVEMLFRNMRTGQIVSLVNASFLVWIAQAQVASLPLAAWWLLAAGIAGLRLHQGERFRRADADQRLAGVAGWRRGAVIGAGAAGLTWAAGTLLLMLTGDSTLQLFTAFVMAGMVAGAVSILAADRLAFRVYAWPIMLATIVGAFGTDQLHLAMSAMALVYMLAATRSADYFYATLHDTLQLEHEKDALVAKLEQARTVAERSNRAKTEFLANISHELRTPLNGIIGLGEILNLEDLTPDQHELLTPLRRSADDLMHMINNLIELSTLEAGHVRIADAPFLAVDLAEVLTGRHRSAAAARQLNLTHAIDPLLPPILIGDVDRLRQVFDHLIGNAIKFTDRGSVHMALHVVARDSCRVTVECSVSDTGPGISPAQIQLLDGLLIQGDGSIVRRHGGIGVGLPIVRKLIELLGGQLTIDSHLGAGSRFAFTLDFALPDDAPEAYGR
jgi:signal transduction histidine kinase